MSRRSVLLLATKSSHRWILLVALGVSAAPDAAAQVNRVGAYAEAMKPMGEFEEVAHMIAGVGLAADLVLTPRTTWSAQLGWAFPLLSSSTKETIDKYTMSQLLTGPRFYFAPDDAPRRPFAGVLGGLQYYGFKTKALDPPLGDGYAYSDGGVRWSAAVFAGVRMGDFDLCSRYAYFTASGDQLAYGSLSLSFAWMPRIDIW